MTRFSGVVGYGSAVEDPPNSGIWVDQVTEVQCYGNVVKYNRRLEDGVGLNDNIKVGNSISIVADDELNQDFSKIKYVEWAGALWTVNTVEVESPRLILRLGGVYNGPTPGSP